jgi:hypothetical protein
MHHASSSSSSSSLSMEIISPYGIGTLRLLEHSMIRRQCDLYEYEWREAKEIVCIARSEVCLSAISNLTSLMVAALQSTKSRAIRVLLVVQYCHNVRLSVLALLSTWNTGSSRQAKKKRLLDVIVHFL